MFHLKVLSLFWETGRTKIQACGMELEKTVRERHVI